MSSEVRRKLTTILAADAYGYSAAMEADERRALSALQAAPGLPALQMLVEVAKDEKQHSKEVLEAALAAAHEVKRRIAGAEAAAR